MVTALIVEPSVADASGSPRRSERVELLAEAGRRGQQFVLRDAGLHVGVGVANAVEGGECAGRDPKQQRGRRSGIKVPDTSRTPPSWSSWKVRPGGPGHCSAPLDWTVVPQDRNGVHRSLPWLGVSAENSPWVEELVSVGPTPRDRRRARPPPRIHLRPGRHADSVTRRAASSRRSALPLQRCSSPPARVARVLRADGETRTPWSAPRLSTA